MLLFRPLPNGPLKSYGTNLSSPHQLYTVRPHLQQNLFLLFRLVINSSLQGKALFVCFLLKSTNEKGSVLKDLPAWSWELAACPKVRNRVLSLADNTSEDAFDAFFRPLLLPSHRCWGSPELGTCLFSFTSSPWVIFYPQVSPNLYKLTPKSNRPAKLISRAPISSCCLDVRGLQSFQVGVQTSSASSINLVHPPWAAPLSPVTQPAT